MLTLSRKPGQALVLNIGHDQVIHLTVTEMRGRQVKLAIDAPKQVTILREELIQPSQAVTTQVTAHGQQ
jgi:carbon storage regulator CsrA